MATGMTFTYLLYEDILVCFQKKLRTILVFSIAVHLSDAAIFS
jgi:hypothetical protein